VMEVAGSQESLAKVDDAKQEELLAAHAQFLNSLMFPSSYWSRFIQSTCPGTWPV
jgi:hypothetical protein